MKTIAEDTGRCMDGLFGCSTLEEALARATYDAWADDSKPLHGAAFRKMRSEARQGSLSSNLPESLARCVSTSCFWHDPPPDAVALSKKKMQSAAGSTENFFV
jgi:hypothetical protein